MRMLLNMVFLGGVILVMMFSRRVLLSMLLLMAMKVLVPFCRSG